MYVTYINQAVVCNAFLLRLNTALYFGVILTDILGLSSLNV